MDLSSTLDTSVVPHCRPKPVAQIKRRPQSLAMTTKRSPPSETSVVSIGVLFSNPADTVAYTKALQTTPGLRTLNPKEVVAPGGQSADVWLSDKCLRSTTHTRQRVVLLAPGAQAASCSCCVRVAKSLGWETLVDTLRGCATVVPQNALPNQALESEETCRGVPERVGVVQTEHGGEDPSSPGSFDKLTPREREVLHLISRGFSVRRCAHELGLAESTVGNHKYRMMRKLGVGSSLELLSLAYQHGVVQA